MKAEVARVLRLKIINDQNLTIPPSVHGSFVRKVGWNNSSICFKFSPGIELLDEIRPRLHKDTLFAV